MNLTFTTPKDAVTAGTFLTELADANLMYHPEDCAADCLDQTGTSADQIRHIQANMELCFEYLEDPCKEALRLMKATNTNTPDITPDQLADQFRKVIFEWLGSDVCQQIDLANKSNPPIVCASHDYCDSNMAMDEALQAFGIDTEPTENGMPEEIAALWNDAWNLAKEKGFSHAN